MRIALFQPCYPHGKPQTYLPGSLMNLGSRLLQAGVETTFTDLNFERLNFPDVQKKIRNTDMLGWTVLGPPYIPRVIEDIRHVREIIGFKGQILVGGQGIANLQQISDFEEWFKGLGLTSPVISDTDIEWRLSRFPGSLRSQFETSATRMLLTLSKEQLQRYLTQEFALFMSDGCKYNCRFCAANKGRREQYRTLDSLKDEVEFIASFLQSIGHSSLTAYLTNLDTFQNPEQLETRLEAVKQIADRHGITLHLRCLATSCCTIEACHNDPALPHRLRSYGLETVGFGADGATEEVWARENKWHNSRAEIREVVELMLNAKITPEILMVIGFQDDDGVSLMADMEFSFQNAQRGAVIRPYLGKSCTPCGRWEEDDPGIEHFRKNPALLERLDYAMLGSRETHPRRWQRWMANGAYLGMQAFLKPFHQCPTNPLVPVPAARGCARTLTQKINRLMPFDR